MITVDAMGEACPIPVVKAKKAYEEAKEHEIIEVLVDNEIALQNVSKMGKACGGKVTSEKLEEGKYRITLEKMEAACELMDGAETQTIVVVPSRYMGVGNEELGGILMKGFLFALTQLPVLPKKIIFYNGGAHITCEGSDSLEDLQNMEKQGVQIFTCGTCLDYYGLKDKLQVGEVTNMYSIVEMMEQADKILRP